MGKRWLAEETYGLDQGEKSEGSVSFAEEHRHHRMVYVCCRLGLGRRAWLARQGGVAFEGPGSLRV